MKRIIAYLLIIVYRVQGDIDFRQYDNFTIDPAERQLYDFQCEHPKPIGLYTTSAGKSVEIREQIAINGDQFTNQNHLDTSTHFNAERIPERIVHAKGTAALGYFEVTNDVSKYISAKVFNGIGKKTPLVVRFSTSIQNLGGTDLSRELKGMAVKFYTEDGNLDLLCLQTPVFLHRDPFIFPTVVHGFKRNPRTNLFDLTQRWEVLTLRPITLHMLFWTESDYGLPNGYSRMDSFAVHTYEINNKHGERYYVRFNFRTEQGLDFLTAEEAATIADLDFATRDLYNIIAEKNFPSWRLDMDILTFDQLKHLDYDPFDVTRLWKNGTYDTVTIGRLVLNKNPDNQFNVAEQSAFNPGSLVPGIPGPVDDIFKSRGLFYRDAQNYRLGTNHEKIEVNTPLHAKTYNRDGVPPLRENMRDAPNYYPNSFNGPMPFVDVTRPKEKLLILQSNAVDLEPLSQFYNDVLATEAQRQRFATSMAASLVPVKSPVIERALKLMYLIDKDLGMRITTSLEVQREARLRLEAQRVARRAAERVAQKAANAKSTTPAPSPRNYLKKKYI